MIAGLPVCSQELFQLELDSNAKKFSSKVLHEVNAHPIGQGFHFIVRDITADFKRKLAFDSRQIAYLPMLLTVSCTRIPQTWTPIPIKTQSD